MKNTIQEYILSNSGDFNSFNIKSVPSRITTVGTGKDAIQLNPGNVNFYFDHGVEKGDGKITPKDAFVEIYEDSIYVYGTLSLPPKNGQGPRQIQTFKQSRTSDE